jgi:hypothetical protein
MMTKLTQIGAVALLGGAALMFSASGASAYTVCNDNGDCWHQTTKYTTPVHVTYYDDNWDWKAHNYRWHDVVDTTPGYWNTKDNKWVVVKQTTTTTTTTTTPQNY